MEKYSPKVNCPENAIAYEYTPTGEKEDTHMHWTYRTCYCEQHCSWDECYLVDPPKTCLDGTDRVWVWSSAKTCWFAQTIDGHGMQESQILFLVHSYW